MLTTILLSEKSTVFEMILLLFEKYFFLSH